MKNVLITGISGFAGSFLAEHLLTQNDVEIHGTYLTDQSLDLVASTKEKLHLEKVNLMDASAVEHLIEKIKPDEIYHLAALTSPAGSFDNPAETISNNISAEIYLLAAIKKAKCTDCRIMITSSADIYGNVKSDDLPIDEETPLRPVSPYAVSKIAQDYLGLQYFLSDDLHIFRVRPFNHIGPTQSPHFVVPAFAKQIAEIEKGKSGPIIKVGNLESKKDFTDVRDMVKAYALLMEKAADGEVYNIGSGKSVQIKEILDTLLSFSTEKISVEQDPERFRENLIPDLVADSSKMQELTGWTPEIPIDQTLEDTLTYWREHA